MSNLYVRETFENADKEAVFGESGMYETFTGNKGELYRSLQREYGRCEGFMYLGNENDGQVRRIGWVFISRQKYTDSPETYLRRVWVEVFRKVGEHTILFDVGNPIVTR